MSSIRKATCRMFGSALLLGAVASPCPGFQEVRLGNQLLEVVVRRDGERLAPLLVHDRRSGSELELPGQDFVLELTDDRLVPSSQCTLERMEIETDGPSVRRLVQDLRHPELEVRMITELRTGEWWVRRWLELRRAPGAAADLGITAVTFGRWRCPEARGPSGPGETIPALGYPSGCGQVVLAGDFFLGLAHPAAGNFVNDGRVSCRLPEYRELPEDGALRSRELVLGAGAAGDAWRAFVAYLERCRADAGGMLFLVNDWYWPDKSRPLEAAEALARVKRDSGVPLDSFTLDDGWDFDWDEATGLWGRLNRERFPGGWEALRAAGRPVDLGVSLWVGPIGGYGTRAQRVEFGQSLGFEIQSDRLCLAGPRYRAHVLESFARWAERGMDYIKVDGFWPDCAVEDHGHPVGEAGAVAQMDALIEVFDGWRRARPELRITYTSGSNPSPFWLLHAHSLWRGGLDDSHAGGGAPFDRHHTYLDTCLQAHRETTLPISALVTFDIVQGRIAGGDDEAFTRGAWWLAARTSLHHDWYVAPDDLTLPQWKQLAEAARWARRHEEAFRYGRMVGGDPAQDEVYGFSAWHGGGGTLALRNPADTPGTITASLAELLVLADGDLGRSLRLRGVFGETDSLEGERDASAPLTLELPALAIAVFEVVPAR